MLAGTRVRSKRSKHGTRMATAEAQRKAAFVNPSQYAKSEFARHLLASRWDIAYFAEHLLGIKPHPGQVRIWETMMKRDSSGWQPRFMNICIAAGNRAGKTLAVSIAILHNTIFKIGMEPPNPQDERSVMRWANAVFEWYHFAIAQETAELAYIEMTRILDGHHEAQPNGCPLTEQLGRSMAITDKKYRGEYLMITLHEALGGGVIHFRTTGEKAIGSLGKDMHGVSYDEAGFDPNFEFVVNEVLHMRRASTGGQMWLIGTATEGLTSFADKWEEGNPENPMRNLDAMSLRMSTRDNIGYGITQQRFDRMVAGMPAHLVPQNIDGFFIEGRSNFFSSQSVDAMFVEGLPEEDPGKYGHRYVQGCDPAITFDSMWSIVLDSTLLGHATGVCARRINGRTTGPVIAALATNQHQAYTHQGRFSCVTGIDATGFGGKMFRDLLYIKPLRSIEFGGTRGKKLKLLNNLKQHIERGQLKFPRIGIWLELRRQLLGYQLVDKNMKTDAVMALAVAVDGLASNAAGAEQGNTFDYFGTGGSNVVSSPPTAPLAVGGPRRIASYSSLSEMRELERS